MKRILSIWITLGLTLSVAGGLAGQQNTRDVYVVPFSHLDFFWGGTREECLARGNRIIAKAVSIGKQHADFRFLVEDDDFVANYVESHKGSPDLEDFKRLVREGHIEISPKWAAIFQDLQDGEVLSRNFIYGKRYAKDVFGVDPLTAHLGDLPGYTPQYPQILKLTRTPEMVMTRMGPPEHPAFFWEAPDGSKALTWFSFKGYGWGSKLGLSEDITREREQTISKDVAEVTANTQTPIFMNWGSDLHAPSERLIPNLAALNIDSKELHFTFATPDEYFQHIGNTTGLPVLRGEIPSSWPNIVSSLPHMWPLVVPATATLEAAERFAAINYALGYADYPEDTFDFLWKKLIESTDHNHDGQGGQMGDQRKADYSRLSIITGGEILRDSLRNIAERVRIPIEQGKPVVIFNPEGWTRDDIVRAHMTLYGDVVPARLSDFKAGMRLVDEHGTNVPFHVDQYSENISRALELSFVAHAVPAIGYKTYYLKAAPANERLPEAARVTLDDPNDTRDPRRAFGSDVMENDFYRVTVDRATGRMTLSDKALNRDVVKDMEISALEERGGNYVGIEPLSGRTIYSSIDRVEMEENNAVRATMRISGRIADTTFTQRLSLWKELKRLDIENTINWRTVRYMRIEQVIPYQIHSAKIQYGVPFGSNAAENLIPGSGPHLQDEISKDSWLNARHVQDWIYAGAPDWGLTVATDHQFVRLDGGVFRGEIVRGTRSTSVKVVTDTGVDSLHYPPPGDYVVRYSITSGAGDWKANKSYRAGLNLNNPLIPVSVVDDISTKALPPSQSFLETNSDSLVLSAVKKAGRGTGIVARWYENEGATTNLSVRFLGKDATLSSLNLLEEPLSTAASVRPFEIRTVQINPSR
jgi:Glycosyl hydrolases family 38 N-terminal domain/Glycosyl hydrolases family 38 C-terminal domain/Glycosyl hydrolases family 38 C-terminal beta sandwich domain